MNQGIIEPIGFLVDFEIAKLLTHIDTGRIELRQLLVEPPEVQGTVAKVRVTVLLAATGVFTGKPAFPSTPFVYDGDLAEIEGEWKLLSFEVAQENSP